MDLQDCYPANKRKNKGKQLFHCKACWKARCEGLQKSDKLIVQKRSKEKKDLKIKAKVIAKAKEIVKGKEIVKAKEKKKKAGSKDVNAANAAKALKIVKAKKAKALKISKAKAKARAAATAKALKEKISKHIQAKADRKAKTAARAARAKNRDDTPSRAKTPTKEKKAETPAEKGVETPTKETTTAKNAETPAEKGVNTAEKRNVDSSDYFAFGLNENVSTTWDKPDIRYHSQICRRVVTEDGPRYDVFYPEDSETKVNVPESELEESSITTGFWSKTRDQYFGEKFVNPSSVDGNKEGEYTLIKFDEEHINKYVCQHTVSGFEVSFGVGFVLRTLQKTEQNKRQD